MEYKIQITDEAGNIQQYIVSRSASSTEGQIAHQMEMDDEEDSYWEDEDNFQCCDNCDLPDACCDFGCAIKQCLRRDEWF